MLEKIESYLEGINFEILTMEELEHYTSILIMLENKHLADKDRNNFQEKLEKMVTIKSNKDFF